MAKETGNCLHEPLPRTDTVPTQRMKDYSSFIHGWTKPMRRPFWDVNSSSVHREVTIYFMEPQR